MNIYGVCTATNLLEILIHNGYCITVSNPNNARNINRKEHIKKERNNG